MAGLEDQVAAGVATRSADGLRPGEQLRAIRARVEELVARQDRIFLDLIVPALAEAGIRLSDWSSLDDDDRAYLVEVFQRQIFPVLTPLGGRPGPPLPLHLQPLAQPAGGGGGPGDRRAADRPGEGPPGAPPVRGHARRRAVRPARAGDRGPPRHPVPRHDRSGTRRVPGHPQRRPGGRRGRGRRPAGGGRDGAAPAPLRAGRAPRDRRRRRPRDARAAGARAGGARPTASTRSRPRSASAGSGRSTGWTDPTCTRRPGRR